MTSPGIKLNRSQEAAMRLVLERRGELSQGRVIHAEFVDGWLISGNFTGDLYGIEPARMWIYKDMMGIYNRV